MKWQTLHAQLGVSPSTIRLWERKKRIRCARTAGGRRRVPESEIRRLRGEDAVPPRPRVVALYARVSSHDQKAKGDEEWVADLLAMVTSFAGKQLYGLRSHRKARELVKTVKEAVCGAGDV